jgi:glycosyltransferase involved in cell wall biosynthesis
MPRLGRRSSAPDRSRLRVLTLVDGIGTHGGGESLAREITQRLNPDRFDRALCVSRWVPERECEAALTELREAGVEFVGLERRGRLDLRAWRPVIRKLRDRQVDVLHSHKFGSNVWAAALATIARPPVFVAHEHTWSYEGDRLRVLLDRRLVAARADALIAVSRDDQRKMIEVEGVPPEKTRFIPNGIEMEPPPRSARDEVRAELGLNGDQPVVGTVATMRSQKALDVLIDAAQLLHRDRPELVVLIVGGEDSQEPEEPARLRGLVSEMGADGSVRFLGLRDDVPRLLAAFDVAAISSDYEGSPLAAMEYMEAGLPVVATRVGGLEDIVVDGETGILVSPRDARQLAAGLGQLLDDADLAHRMGEAGRERRRTEFDLSQTVHRVERLYEELYAGTTAGWD